MSEKVVAIARLAVMLIAAVAGAFGLTVDADSLLTIAACVVALAAGIWSWWKNNNLTEAAQIAQGYLDALKEGAEIVEATEETEEATEEAEG